MDSKIRIKSEFEMGCKTDRNLYFADKGQDDLSSPSSQYFNKENLLPPPPPLTPKPPKNYEIGIRININQFKSLSNPFISGKNYFESINKDDLQIEPKSSFIAKNTRKARSGKVNSMKRRRNSASSDSSQSSTSSSLSYSSQEDCLEMYNEPQESTRRRSTNVSNRKRLRIRDEIGNQK